MAIRGLNQSYALLRACAGGVALFEGGEKDRELPELPKLKSYSRLEKIIQVTNSGDSGNPQAPAVRVGQTHSYFAVFFFGFLTSRLGWFLFAMPTACHNPAAKGQIKNSKWSQKRVFWRGLTGAFGPEVHFGESMAHLKPENRIQGT